MTNHLKIIVSNQMEGPSVYEGSNVGLIETKTVATKQNVGPDLDPNT